MAKRSTGRSTHGTARAATAGGQTDAARLLDIALAQAETDGWENLRLRKVADAAGITLAELCRHYRDTDALADAWFRRARDAMLAPMPDDFLAQPAAERLGMLMMRWFDALAPHRRVTAEMIGAKLWPFHPHHYVPAVFHLSRHIQCWRDAARLDAGGRRRQIEEIALTALFLGTLRTWCRDDGDGQADTRAYLTRQLERADALAARCFGRSRP
ncbi:MAG: TetR/AcrR family transcriptional regulator [Rhodospirillales bacterium]